MRAIPFMAIVPIPESINGTDGVAVEPTTPPRGQRVTVSTGRAGPE